MALTDIDGWRQTDPRSHGRHQHRLKRLSRTPIEGGGGGGDKVPVGNRPPRTRQLCFQAQRHLRRTACCAPLLRVQVPRPTRPARHADVVMVFLDTIRAHPHIEVARTLHTKLPEEHPVLSSLVRRHHTASRLCITVTIVSWLEHARMSRR